MATTIRPRRHPVTPADRPVRLPWTAYTAPPLAGRWARRRRGDLGRVHDIHPLMCRVRAGRDVVQSRRVTGIQRDRRLPKWRASIAARFRRVDLLTIGVSAARGPLDDPPAPNQASDPGRLTLSRVKSIVASGPRLLRPVSILRELVWATDSKADITASRNGRATSF
jgi:hypothetical protein